MTQTKSNAVVHLHADDNICVAARNLAEGEQIVAAGKLISLGQPVRLGHKIATRSLRPGDLVRKYGQVIGSLTHAARAGEWVHTHNLVNGEFARDYAPASATPAPPAPITDRVFQGYRRAGGKAGTRNYVAVISSVNCSATVSKHIARRFPAEALRAFPNVDGVVAITHAGGCGMQFGGLQHDLLNRTLGGFARHVNIGGYLLVGLGCEQGALGYLVQQQRLLQIEGVGGRPEGPPMFSMQDLGGTAKTVEAGVRALAEILPRVNAAKRVPVPASELVLGLECGGSDGNSGVTANPALGVAADLLVACGGTAILSETSEIYGAEHLLTRRAVSKQVADKLLERIEWWKWYVKVFGADLDNNPSVGNKEGGLTTIAEKSLGAVAKAGSTALVDVYHYAEPVTAKGLVVMDTPGFDPPSVTGMVAGGANVVVFTTGRGSCFGCKPTPSIKLASNTPMYERMRDDMDLNAGTILTGARVDEVGREIFEEILAVASGKKTKSEELGYGDDEFMPWAIGPVL